MDINAKELNYIKLYDIPTGKQCFIATVEKIVEEDEVNYYGNLIPVPYIYLKNIKILIDKSWFYIDCSNVPIRSKIGKRLEKLELEREDIINEEVDSEPVEYLPKDYKGTIIVEFYETEFTPIERISKNNFTKVYDRRGFNKKYKNFYCKREANGKSKGYYKEPQAMYYQGKSIKNLSNIEKF